MQEASEPMLGTQKAPCHPKRHVPADDKESWLEMIQRFSSCAGLVYFITHPIEDIKWWWKTTTDPAWLMSGTSRRHYLRFTAPVIALLMWRGQFNRLPLGALGALVIFYKPGIVWHDYILAAVFYAATAHWWDWDIIPHEHLDEHFFTTASPLLWLLLVLFGLMGVHCTGLAMLLLGWTHWMAGGTVSMAVWLLLYGSVFVVIFGVMEYNSALQFATLQEVLDVATNGACNIDKHTGQILRVEKGLAETLGESKEVLLGKTFGDYVHEEDHRKVQRFFLDKAGDNEVKCKARFMNGDAYTIIRYSTMSQSVCICLQPTTEEFDDDQGDSTLEANRILDVTKCESQKDFEEKVSAHAAVPTKRMTDIVMNLLISAGGPGKNCGGVLFVVVRENAFNRTLFREGQGVLRTSDRGYMNDRMKGSSIESQQFQEAFEAFTDKDFQVDDKWPMDYEDERARGRPKDGGFFVNYNGIIVAAAAKILGLPARYLWENVGTKHEAAMACAAEIPGSVAFVKSESGPVHCIMRRTFEDTEKPMSRKNSVMNNESDIIAFKFDPRSAQP
eukprot:TRINITY_DN7842_c0_g1_i1.p1 TRINITY_DN7842_c0_g1~~TRINITY_DN7842_c0_g1_i1.p1  ORF type:complete len:559 (-),score=93.21 TRINITY_DN7842_c0_g1_i1:77-1753(-)